MAQTSLPPGFRFHPTDVELVSYYLKRKIMGKKLVAEVISVVDLYKYAPWDLPDLSRLRSRDLEWYFFCPREKKYPNGSRTNRVTPNGYWKSSGADKSIVLNSRTVGMKRVLIFHQGKAPKGDRTDWVMYEYKMEDNEVEVAGFSKDAYVLCKLFKKSGLGPKIGEQYGAPFNEEEWDGVNAETAAFPWLPCPSSNAVDVVDEPPVHHTAAVEGLSLDSNCNCNSATAIVEPHTKFQCVTLRHAEAVANVILRPFTTREAKELDATLCRPRRNLASELFGCTVPDCQVPLSPPAKRQRASSLPTSLAGSSSAQAGAQPTRRPLVLPHAQVPEPASVVLSEHSREKAPVTSLVNLHKTKPVPEPKIAAQGEEDFLLAEDSSPFTAQADGEEPPTASEDEAKSSPCVEVPDVANAVSEVVVVDDIPEPSFAKIDEDSEVAVSVVPEDQNGSVPLDPSSVEGILSKKNFEVAEDNPVRPFLLQALDRAISADVGMAFDGMMRSSVLESIKADIFRGLLGVCCLQNFHEDVTINHDRKWQELKAELSAAQSKLLAISSESKALGKKMSEDTLKLLKKVEAASALVARAHAELSAADAERERLSLALSAMTSENRQLRLAAIEAAVHFDGLLEKLGAVPPGPLSSKVDLARVIAWLGAAANAASEATPGFADCCAKSSSLLLLGCLHGAGCSHGSVRSYSRHFLKKTWSAREMSQAATLLRLASLCQGGGGGSGSGY